MSDNRGLLISFDGTDSSGKKTQTSLLAERLRSGGRTVRALSSPDYTTESGQALKTRLQDQESWRKMPWEEKLSYFATNRAEHREEVITALARQEIIVYDRYVPSSVAFMIVEARQENVPHDREHIQTAVKEKEYSENGMPREDLSIFLDVPPDVAEKLLVRRKVKNQDADEYTDHLEVQHQLYTEYDLLSRAQPEKFLRITCMEEGKLLLPAQIHDRIWQGLTRRFPQLQSI